MDINEDRIVAIEKKLDNMADLLRTLIQIYNTQQENNIEGFKLVNKAIIELATKS